MRENPLADTTANVVAMSAEHIFGWVLVSVFGPIVLFGGLAAAVLWYRNWRIYHPRRYRPTRAERRAARRYEPLAWMDQDTDQFPLIDGDEEFSSR